MVSLLLGGLALFILFLFLYSFSPLKRPFPTESDYTYHRTPWWQLYYSSKYLSPVKRPARGTGLKELFAQDMGPVPEKDQLQDSQEITLTAVGDLMCRRDLVGKGGENLWEHIGSDLFSGDLCIANMEFAVNPDWVIEKLLRFSVPQSYAEPLLGDHRFGRFHAVSLANNHINDSLSDGIISTCNYLEKIGMLYSGANRTKGEQDEFPIIDCKGIKIALLSYTFSTNAIPLEQHFQFGTNLVRFNALDDNDYDPSLIFHHVTCARERGADVIVACNHWGVEFEYYPPERIVRRAHELIDGGVDLIIGHHPHILNLSERYRAKDGRDGFILYSLGNLTSWGLKFPLQKMSHLARITLVSAKKSDAREVRIGNVTLMPILHTMNKRDGLIHHSLLPVLRLIEDDALRDTYKKLSIKDRLMLRSVYKEHKNYFRQKGIVYA